MKFVLRLLIVLLFFAFVSCEEDSDKKTTTKQLNREVKKNYNVSYSGVWAPDGYLSTTGASLIITVLAEPTISGSVVDNDNVIDLSGGGNPFTSSPDDYQLFDNDIEEVYALAFIDTNDNYTLDVGEPYSVFENKSKLSEATPIDISSDELNLTMVFDDTYLWTE